MPHLLEPLRIGILQLPNRLVMPPMAPYAAEVEGKVSQQLLDYYNEKTLGGYFGLVITEQCYISSIGKTSDNQLSVADDNMLEGLKALVRTIHKNGSKVVQQINHAGSSTTAKIAGATPVGPSAVEHPRLGTLPRELSIAEIGDITKEFGLAACRAKEAGFDGVELHAGHGYLLNQFMSPLTNRREDDYGGTLPNRIRLHLQVIKGIKELVGEGFPLFVRLGVSDYIEGGLTLEDGQFAATEFTKAGVDVLDVSGGHCGYTVPSLTGQGYFAPLAQGIKEVVDLPVILTGGIKDAQVADRLVSEGKADLIGVGRALLHDSLWAKRAVALVSGLNNI